MLARQALREALHLRLGLLVGMAGLGLCGGAAGLRQYSFGQAELKFMADFGGAVTGLTSMVLAALVPAQLFFRDLESRTMDVLLTRTVRRWEYLAGKFAGTACLLAGYIGILSLLLTMILVRQGRQLGEVQPVLFPIFFAGALLWMKCTLVAAMTLLVCSYAGSALFAGCTGLMLALVGQLRSLPSGGALTVLQVWPNLTLFNPEKLLTGPATMVGPWLLGLAFYWAAYLLLLGALASYGLKHREF